MAFNPLTELRKHSKAFFAVMAIICMLTFVLSSGMGQGDLLNQVSEWFGSSKYPAQAKIDGAKIDSRQLGQLSQQRQLANSFMSAAVGYSSNNLVRQVQELQSKLSPEIQAQIRRILTARSSNPEQYLSQMPQSQMMMNFMYSQAEKDKKKDQQDAFAAVTRLMDMDRYLIQNDRAPGEAYFGGRFDSVEDLVNFMVWKREADRLNIQLGVPEVQQAVVHECFYQLSQADTEEITKQLKRQFPTFTSQSLYEALNEEFRVRAAQTALSGIAPMGNSALPVVLTPDERWELYRDARTQIKVGVVEVPVTAFLGQVAAQPTAADIKSLYEQYRAEEPSPERDAPGFKQPRQIQVGWFSASADMPFYQLASKQLAPLQLAVLQFGSANALDAVLGWELPQVALAATPVVFDFRLDGAYDRYSSSQVSWMENTGTGSRGGLHDSNVLNLDVAKFLVAGGFATAGTGAPVFSGPLSMEGTAIALEVASRARLGATEILAGACEPYCFGAIGTTLAAIPATPTKAQVASVLQEQLRDQLAQSLFNNDLGSFFQEALRKSQDPDKKKAAAYLQEFIAYRGLTKGSTSQLRDELTLAADPGLQPLVSDYKKSPEGLQDPSLKRFAAIFFANNQRDMMGGIRPNELYQPQFYQYGDFAKGIYTFTYRTEDKAAKIVPFDQAKPQVEAAWKLQKAKELAKQAADKLAIEARATQADVQKLRDLAAQQGSRTFYELGPQAQYNPQLTASARQQRDFRMFEVPEDKVPYPGPRGYNGITPLAEQIIALRNQPKGTSVVLHDAPKSRYLVVTLLEKSDPSIDEFRRSYVHSMDSSAEPDPLLNELARTKRQNFRVELLKELRQIAKVEILANDKSKADSE